MNKLHACLIGSLLLSTPSLAQQIYYVDDELTITMRSGASTQHQILKTLKSGERLEIIETDKESGYSLARLDNGTEGWVITRYLTKSPIARDQLQAAKAELEKANKELTDLKKELRETSSARTSLDKSNTGLASENKRLSNELAHITEISGNAVALDQDNKTMREQIIRMETQIQTLQQQNEVLKDRSTRDWFITGAIVTVIGIFIGLLVPRLRVKRKSNWNEL